MKPTLSVPDSITIHEQDTQELIKKLIDENLSLKKRNQELELLNNMAKTVVEDLDIKKIMQSVIDAGTQLSGAGTGAFFYNTDVSGSSYILYTISGESIEASSFILPDSLINAGDKVNQQVIRSNNITIDEVNFKNIKGRSLEGIGFKSYMVAPVISKTGKVLGRLFFTHKDSGKFTEKEEYLVSLLSAHAAVALEVSKLVESKESNLEHFRSMAESIPQMVWTGREDGYIDFFNLQWLEYTGLSFEDLKGMGWTKVLHPDDIEKTIKQWTAAVNSGEKFELEYRLKKANEINYRWHLGRALPIKNKSGQIIKWFGTCTDIDDQKKLQEKKDEFFGIASHELKTPITSIKAYVQLLERLLTDNSTAKDYLGRANTYIDRLNSLIADLLDVSKIQAGRLPFHISEFEFDHLVKDAVECVQPTLQKHRIIIEGEAGQIVRGDRQRLEQVFVNYLSNAIKYSPQSDKVLIRVSKNNKEVKVAVEDFGIGIPKENQEKIFDRFYRVEADCKKFSGLGIGLYISSEIVKRHKGKTWVDSTEGKGSIFYFSIPIKKDLKTAI